MNGTQSIRTEKQYSSRHPFDHDIGHDTSHLPRINEFSFTNLGHNHFQFACSILQCTIFNVATPMHQFDVIPSKPTNHMRVYQTLAMILLTHSSGVDVTAATCDFEAFPPVFTLFYSKNKITMEIDRENESQLYELVQDYAAFNDHSVFFGKILFFYFEGAIAKVEGVCSKTRIISRCYDSRHLGNWSAEDSNLQSQHDELPGDVFLKNMASINKYSPIQAVTL